MDGAGLLKCLQREFRRRALEGRLIDIHPFPSKTQLCNAGSGLVGGGETLRRQVT